MLEVLRVPAREMAALMGGSLPPSAGKGETSSAGGGAGGGGGGGGEDEANDDDFEVAVFRATATDDLDRPVLGLDAASVWHTVWRDVQTARREALIEITGEF